MSRAKVTTYRRHCENNFTIVPNELIADPDLSFKAKGVLIYLLSKPETWQTRMKDIVAHGTEGEFAVKGALDELCQQGYMRRTREHSPDGTWMSVTDYSNVRYFAETALNGGRPHAETADGPHAETADGPHAETALLSKTEEVTRLSSSKTENNSSPPSVVRACPTPEFPLAKTEDQAAAIDAFEALWKRYPRDSGPIGAKRTALVAWMKLKPAERSRAASNLANYVAGKGDQYTMHCSTYLSRRTGKGYDAWDEPPEPVRARRGSDGLMSAAEAGALWLAERQAHREPAAQRRPELGMGAGRG